MSKILVAEDSRDIRDLIVMSLEIAGHEVLQATDGQEAWEMLSLAAHDLADYDLAVVDNMMPRLSGLALVERCRGDAILRNLLIVMVTARAQSHEVEAGLDAGVDRYVTKPFSPRDLAAVVGELLARPAPA